MPCPSYLDLASPHKTSCRYMAAKQLMVPRGLCLQYQTQHQAFLEVARQMLVLDTLSG